MYTPNLDNKIKSNFVENNWIQTFAKQPTLFYATRSRLTTTTLFEYLIVQPLLYNSRCVTDGLLPYRCGVAHSFSRTAPHTTVLHHTIAYICDRYCYQNKIFFDGICKVFHKKMIVYKKSMCFAYKLFISFLWFCALKEFWQCFGLRLIAIIYQMCSGNTLNAALTHLSLLTVCVYFKL